MRARLGFLFMRSILVNVVCIFVILITCPLKASDINQQKPYPENIFITFAEGMTGSTNDEGIETGYRMWTVITIKEMLTKIHVNSLEVYPPKIELKVGEVYSLKNLRVTARNADAQIVEHAPIFLAYSQYVLCYDNCNQGWGEIEPRVIEIVNRYDEADLIRGLRPGRIELRIQTLSHRNGTCPVIYFDLVVQ